jgi:putative nucleotidyltransferase with HDIG domain
MTTSVSRQQAFELFCEWTQSDSLRKHVLGVEAAMRTYARLQEADEELWAVTGILHDLDYERFPDPDTGHPRVAIEELTRRDYPDELIDAVAGHADYLHVPRRTELAKTLYAVDELSGFIAACALVRPQGIEQMSASSVKKKLKQKSFAAAVDREQMKTAADELGVDFTQHIQRVIAALEERANDLGLAASQVK